MGARSTEQMRDNLGCLEFDLTREQMDALDAANPIRLGFPHDFLSGDHVQGLVFGETKSLIHNHRR